MDATLEAMESNEERSMRHLGGLTINPSSPWERTDEDYERYSD